MADLWPLSVVSLRLVPLSEEPHEGGSGAVAQHFVRVVDDGTLATGDGWAIARCEETGSLFFIVERSSAQNEQALHDAWRAAANLVIEEAVREGIVRSLRPEDD